MSVGLLSLVHGAMVCLHPPAALFHIVATLPVNLFFIRKGSLVPSVWGCEGLQCAPCGEGMVGVRWDW